MVEVAIQLILTSTFITVVQGYRVMTFIEKVAQGKWYDPSLVEGYTESEIQQIEHLYDIRITGEFKEFMLCMGRCSGGLLAEDTTLLYMFQPKTFLLVHDSYKDELLHYSGYDFSYQHCFFFGCIGEETDYFFLKTHSDNPQRVYKHGDGDSFIIDTGKDFIDYVMELVLLYANEDAYNLNFRYQGELLPIVNQNKPDYIENYHAKKQQFVYNLAGNKTLDFSKVEGYTLNEIDTIASLYEINIQGELRNFLHFIGKSSGGLLDEKFIFYNTMNVMEKVSYINNAIDLVWNKKPELYSFKDKFFVFMTYNRKHHFFLVTNHEDMNVVHQIEHNHQFISKTNKSFLQFVKEFIAFSKDLPEGITGNLLN